MPADLTDREWFCDWPRLRGDKWWRTPYVAVRFGRCWMVSVAAGPWHLTFGYMEMF